MNVKEELLEIITKRGLKIKCASIYTQDYDFIPEIDKWGYIKPKNCILKVNYNQQDYKDFLQSLDFEYDDGFGRQELFGIVLFEDNSWLERYEYDGSERWDYRTTPQIPEECL